MKVDPPSVQARKRDGLRGENDVTDTHRGAESN